MLLRQDYCVSAVGEGLAVAWGQVRRTQLSGLPGSWRSALSQLTAARCCLPAACCLQAALLSALKRPGGEAAEDASSPSACSSSTLPVSPLAAAAAAACARQLHCTM